eukprot:GHVU01039446.1.p1 GENE.GHVU01039446.1~~GHVU01039446.1.p1  ORF type:complete len:117 (-),score=33.10 GHVU01039446.1:232-582(-)
MAGRHTSAAVAAVRNVVAALPAVAAAVAATVAAAVAAAVTAAVTAAVAATVTAAVAATTYCRYDDSLGSCGRCCSHCLPVPLNEADPVAAEIIQITAAVVVPLATFSLLLLLLLLH